ncbi:hypothetical protein [Pedobacter agri]|uniref:hypothetical protein n=1 Tax=Pedobacter agri TaxID=454586 RepID=UPI002787F231|nr:hypothetical protein [Pedobacter agri]MDQ1139396.1 hypothetical protein [Pedobacter agri]
MQTEPQKPIYKPYTNQLAYNVMKALPGAKVLVDSVNIYLYLYGQVKPDLKEWLYSFLETLPEINHPLERVSFALYENDSLEKVVLINPSENDVNSLQDAVDRGLHFSGGADLSWFEPMPLDHPYYSKGKEK